MHITPIFSREGEIAEDGDHRCGNQGSTSPFPHSRYGRYQPRCGSQGSSFTRIGWLPADNRDTDETGRLMVDPETSPGGVKIASACRSIGHAVDVTWPTQSFVGPCPTAVHQSWLGACPDSEFFRAVSYPDAIWHSLIRRGK